MEQVKDKKFKVAVFGIKTLPPTEGCAGAETIAEEIYTRMAQQGHEMVVYCRKYFRVHKDYPKRYKNLRLIYIPTIKKKGFDTLIHSFFCTLHIILFNTGKYIHIHNAGNSIWVPLLRLFGKKCFVGLDGFDWKRSGWPIYARIYLKMTSYLALWFSTRLIIDNVFVQKYYLEKFGAKLDHIPYGVNIKNVNSCEILKKLNLTKGKYILFVGRFIREKGIHYLIEAFENLDTDFNLVLVGGNLFDEDWVNELKSTTDKRIIFTGFLYGQYVDELIQHCYLYVQPSDVEGLSPVILTAMGMGKCVVSSDIPENSYLVENNGFLFEKGNVESLASVLERLLEAEEEVKQKGKSAQEFVGKNFSWDTVVDKYIELFHATSDS